MNAGKRVDLWGGSGEAKLGWGFYTCFMRLVVEWRANSMVLAGDWEILDSRFVHRGGGKSQKVGRGLENEIFGW